MTVDPEKEKEGQDEESSVQEKKEMEWSPSTGKKKDGRRLSCGLGEDGGIIQYRSMRGRQDTLAQESGGRERIKNQTHTMFLDTTVTSPPTKIYAIGLGAFKPRQ